MHILQNFFPLAVLFTFENKKIALRCVIAFGFMSALTLKKNLKNRKLRYFLDVKTILLLRCQSPKPQLNVKLTLKQR